MGTGCRVLWLESGLEAVTSGGENLPGWLTQPSGRSVEALCWAEMHLGECWLTKRE